MRRLVVPALAAALFTLAACGAATETGSEPTPADASSTSPAAAAADVVNAELRSVTIDVTGMG